MKRVLHNSVILPVYLPSIIFAFSQSMLIPVMPLYVLSFDISYSIVGIVLACTGLGMLLSDVPAGMLIRRLGMKWTMVLGIVTVIFSTMALFWAHTIPEVIVYRLLTGFGMALYSVSRHTYMAENIILEGRGRAIALFGGINRIGRFAGPAVGGIIATAYGLRVPLLWVGFIEIVALMAVIFFVRTDKDTRPVGLPEASSGSSIFFTTLKAHYRVFATAGSGQLFAQMIRAGRGVIIPLYAAGIIGLDVQEIGLIISIAAAIDMLLFYPTGIIMDRYGRKFAIVPSFFLQAVGMCLVPFTESFTGLMAATMLIGFGNGLGSGVMMTLGADLAPEDSRGEFLGMWRLIGDSGFTGAPLLVGGIADLIGLSMSAWALSGAGMIAVFIFLFWVPETLKKRRR
ncbi:MAG: MFS transporter [Desulfobacterales bacterium]